MLLKEYIKLKNYLNDKIEIRELDSPYFFSGPNYHSISEFQIVHSDNRIFPEVHKLSPYSSFYDAIVDVKSKIIVFSSPKVGTTSIKVFIQKYLNLTDEIDEKYPHRISFPRIMDFFESDPPFINWSKFDDFELFLIMRDPFERLVSFYLNKYVRNLRKKDNQRGLKYFFNNYYRLSYSEDLYLNPFDLTFRGFVELLFKKYNSKHKVWDRHLSLQATSDLQYIAGRRINAIALNQLSEFLNYWYFKKSGQHNDLSLHINKSQESEQFISLKNAPDIPLSSLINSNEFYEPNSFNDMEIEKKVKQIYSLDYKLWNSIDMFKF